MVNSRTNVNTVDEIKSRCNIVDVIGRVVTLKKAGSIYKGRCPFHNEKTPSFVVYESSQSYKCFGCNEGGDVINFVQKYYNLDFKEAVEMLAKEYGIEINFSFSTSKTTDEFYEINRLAARFFYKALRESKNPAYAYMRKRKIIDETLNKFGIGYADDNWTSLTDHLVSQGYKPEKLLEVGLSSEKDKRFYDKFRGRVIFPIQNTAGKVIGFGGRILNEGEPKYLNSKESSAFQKKNNLYGLNVSKDYVHKEDSIILVEGYMDVISLFQAGVRNVSASLGTALTPNQSKLIKRYTSNVVFSYDADNAGQNATLRGLDILYKEGCKSKVLVVNDGKDPDEFIKSNGRDAFLKLIAEALPYGDYKLAKAKEKYDINDDQQKLNYLRDAIQILKAMMPVEADMYIGVLAKQTGISETAIRREYEGEKQKETQRPNYMSNDSPNEELSVGEQDLIKLMLIDHKFTIIPEDVKEFVFQSAAGMNIYKAILAIDKGERPLNIDLLKDKLDIESSELLNEISLRIIPPNKEGNIFNDCIRHIRQQKLINESKSITNILQNLKEDDDKDEIKRLMQRQMEIQKLIKG